MTKSRLCPRTDSHQPARVRTYQTILGFNMTLHVVIALGTMFLPYFVSRAFGLPTPIPSGWIRGWGATLMLVTALYIPGLRAPLEARYPNFAGILGRLWMATTWFVIGGGLFWFGLFDASFALILLLFYARLFSREATSDASVVGDSSFLRLQD